MSLETEFQLCLQRQRLERIYGDRVCGDRERPTQLEPNTWVELVQHPSPFSFQQARLLCQCGEQWLAWVPDHGEILLSADEFYLPD